MPQALFRLSSLEQCMGVSSTTLGVAPACAQFDKCTNFTYHSGSLQITKCQNGQER